MKKEAFFIAESNKTFEQVLTDLNKSVEKHGFSVINIIDMQKKFQSIGKDSKAICIVEICNPEMSHHAITLDKRMICMMPKSINVYEDDDGKIKVVFMKADADKLEAAFPGLNIIELSKKVAATIESIINDCI